MTTKEAISILQVKKLTFCNQKDFVEALDIAIEALRRAEKRRESSDGESWVEPRGNTENSHGEAQKRH